MEKTISINLSGQNFLIEEEAYEKLAAYLESIKRHCGAGADSTEVIADIENSMAEKLRSSLTPYKEITTVKDVESLITIMGTIEDFNREVGNFDSEDEEAGGTAKKMNRKLYRDTDKAVIGGVAAGLGAYFDMDPVLFRIVFCALVFAGGSGFLIYILLWIAMPEAKTAHQKLEMQGQAPTLAAFKNLAKTGKQLQENWKKRWQNRSTLGKIFNLPLVIINGLFSAIKKIINGLFFIIKSIWKIFWPIVKFCFGLFLTVFSFIILGLAGVGGLFLLLYNSPTCYLSFIPISEMTKTIPCTWIIISGFLSIAIPAILVLIGGIAIIRRKNIMNFVAGSILVGIWMAAGISFCALGLRYYPEVENKFNNYPLTIESEKTVDMAGIKEIAANDYYINIVVSDATATPATLSGRVIDLENIAISREGEKLILEKKPFHFNNICFDCHLRPVTLQVATSSTLKINPDAASSTENAL